MGAMQTMDIEERSVDSGNQYRNFTKIFNKKIRIHSHRVQVLFIKMEAWLKLHIHTAQRTRSL
jgi:hypothetical protein